VASSVKKKAANPEPEGGWDAACLSLLKKLLKHKDAWPFTEPVDAKALKLKDYHKVSGHVERPSRRMPCTPLASDLDCISNLLSTVNEYQSCWYLCFS